MRKLFQLPYALILLMVTSIGYIISCTHDDEIIESAAAKISRGNDVLLPGMIGDGDSSKWKLDKYHSNVQWSTNYVGVSGLLTGRFNQFGLANLKSDQMKIYTYQITTSPPAQPVPDTSWAFYENDPSKTYFNAYVQMNSVNTGEPLRDGGCLPKNSFGTTVFVSGEHNLTQGNIARIKTTKIELDPTSNDYIVTADLTWKGQVATAEPITKSVVGKLKYIKKASAGTYKTFGLQLTFQFNCRDFGVTSISIADKIVMQCNMNFNNK